MAPPRKIRFRKDLLDSAMNSAENVLTVCPLCDGMMLVTDENDAFVMTCPVCKWSWVETFDDRGGRFVIKVELPAEEKPS